MERGRETSSLKPPPRLVGLEAVGQLWEASRTGDLTFVLFGAAYRWPPRAGADAASHLTYRTADATQPMAKAESTHFVRFALASGSHNLELENGDEPIRTDRKSRSGK
jgi:hypothetical protein